MHFFTASQCTAILAFQLISVGAAPVETEELPKTGSDIVRRATGTKNDPHLVDIPCTGMEAVCEADCIAMLCHGLSPLMQRNSSLKEQNYRLSGAYFVPFNEDADMNRRRGITVPSNLPAGAPVFNSAEETSYEATTQGGTGTIIFPVPRDQQSLQGTNINNMYNAYNVRDGDWFVQRFSFLNSDTPHCNALAQNPPDTSICDKEKKNKWGFDMKKFAYKLNPARTNPRTFISMFGGYKKKRDEDGVTIYDEEQ